MNTFMGWGLSFTLFFLGINIPARADAPMSAVEAPATPSVPERLEHQWSPWPSDKLETSRAEANKPPETVFKWGDISWLPKLATEAGWPPETHKKLGQIILRESGGCPNRRGGDAVDPNCNITHVTTWTHRSDTGLLQINGVNYNTKRNKWARVCLDMGICSQEPLLDPLLNLKAGYLLYTYAGWDPWDPCAWGEAWAHRCKKKP